MLPDVIKGYIDARIIRSLGKGHALLLRTSRYIASDRCEKIKVNNVTPIIKMRAALNGNINNFLIIYNPLLYCIYNTVYIIYYIINIKTYIRTHYLSELCEIVTSNFFSTFLLIFYISSHLM